MPPSQKEQSYRNTATRHPAVTMNTRAPTNLHSRAGNSEPSNTIDNINDDDDSEDGPMDECHARNVVNARTILHDEKQALSREDIIEPSQEWGGKYKTKKIRDRPWKKVKEYNGIHLDDDSNDGLSLGGNDNNDDLSLASNDNDHDLDDLSSRWSHQSSKAEMRRATVQAVALASAAAADQADEDDLQTITSNASSEARSRTLRQGRQILSESSYNLRTQNDHNHNHTATPEKLKDHERVRMEALKMLQLADPGSNEDAGYAIQTTKRGGYSTLVSTASIQKDAMMNKKKRNPLQKLGLDHESKAARGGYSRASRSNGQFVHDDEDLIEECQTEGPYQASPVKFSSVEMEELPSNKSKAWSSRYSVDRHLLPLHGGKSSRQVLDAMDKEHYDNLNASSRQSATTLFKTSPHESSDRWNFTSGRVQEEDVYYPRLWYTWYSATRDFMIKSGTAVKETSKEAKDKVEHWVGSVRDKRREEEDSHMTLGSHRHMNHSSSSPKGIFTGVVAIVAKCSPTKRYGGGGNHWRNVNLRGPARDLPNMDFTAQDDYEHDKVLRRRRAQFISLGFILLASVSLVAIFAIKARHRTGGFISSDTTAGETFHFYVVSDTPHNPADATKLSRELQNLQHDDGDFLIHLGDVHAAATSMCTYSSYQDAADLLKESPIPTLVLPGDNDWNNCPRPTSAFAYWSENLNRFEENYKNEEHEDMPSVTRQIGRDENFAFLHKGVLFLGLNLVDGKVQSEREWTIRHQENVQWVEEQINLYQRKEYRAVVLMGHAGATSKVGDFFWPVIDDFKILNKPVLYVHASNGDGILKYRPFDELEDFTALRLEKGSLSSPFQITVTTDLQPFKLNLNQS